VKNLFEKLGLLNGKEKEIKVSVKPIEKDVNKGSEKLNGIDFNHKEKEVILKGSFFFKEETSKQ
jgi:hypothetical protein